MKRIYWKYNPYTLTTEFLVDGERPASMSDLEGYVSSGISLQEHIEKIPLELEKHYNDNHFEITFCGTSIDYTDICDIFNGENYTLIHQQVDESEDKEEQINSLFQKILDGPFEELKENRIKDAYNKIKNNELDISVVAPMSAGKSTLINALLGERLMPSQASACTAIITKIKDCDKPCWDATIRYKNGVEEKQENISQNEMKEFNKNDMVDEILLEGDIPFVTSEETALVLIDTPGPNNARNAEHGNVQRKFLSNSSKSLVLYVLDHNYENTDNTKLLEEISEAMQVHGKQNKDRFIFVLNKVDTINEEDDGSIKNILEDVRIHLESRGIPGNPKIFPVSAYQALLLRMKLSDKLSDVSRRHLNVDMFKYDEFFLEKYAPLPASLNTYIQNKMLNMTEDEKTLIHTGIISLEEYIRLYLTKYAKTGKINNLTAIFNEKLDELAIEETIKNKLSQDETERNRILNQLNKIQEELKSGTIANRFVTEDAQLIIKKIKNKSHRTVDKIRKKYTTNIRKLIHEYSEYKCIEIDEFEEITDELDSKMVKLYEQYEQEITDFIKVEINDAGREVEKRYKVLLSRVSDELSDDLYSFHVDISLFVNSSVLDDDMDDDDVFDKFVTSIENEDIKWYKPWTWFYDEYVPGVKVDKFVQYYFTIIEVELNAKLNRIKEVINEQAKNIIKDLSKKIQKLDNHISQKVNELTCYGNDKEIIEQNIATNKYKLEWIRNIKQEMDEILELKEINI